MRFLVIAWILFLVLPGTLEAPAQPPPGDGPWQRDLLILDSSDGLKAANSRVFVSRGGVPSMVRDTKGRLIAAFQWFPFEKPECFDRVAVKFSDNEGRTWSDPQPIVVKGLPENYIRPCDPTLAVLEDERLRIYFTSDPRDRKGPGTYSAVSSDGINYAFEPGPCFRVEGETVLDCAVARLGKVWHYFAPVQGPESKGYHAISNDGLMFTRLPDLMLPGDHRWLGNAVSTKEGLRFYGSGRDGVWTATSRDGATWQLEPAIGVRGGDPAVVQRKDGSYLIVVTGERRKDAVAPSSSFGQTALSATTSFLYVVRNGVLFQYDAKDLRLLRQTTLTSEIPR